MTTSYNIELGSFINFEIETDTTLKDKIYYVDYIDNENIRLIDINTLDKIFFKIVDQRIQIDGLKSINILNLPEEKGYARQNGLLPSKWINIHFGGDLPTIFIGQITNLEDDMIEIKLIGNEIIYIDFAYQGIPLNLPITEIEIRDEPSELEKKEEQLEEEIKEQDGIEEDVEIIESGQQPVEKIKSQVKEFILNAEQFQIGESIGNLQINVEVSESEKRYSLEAQINDLLDKRSDLLSNDSKSVED